MLLNHPAPRGEFRLRTHPLEEVSMRLKSEVVAARRKFLHRNITQFQPHGLSVTLLGCG